MKHVFRMAPSGKTFNIGWRRRQQQLNAQKPPNSFSRVLDEERQAILIQQTIRIFDDSIFEEQIPL